MSFFRHIAGRAAKNYSQIKTRVRIQDNKIVTSAVGLPPPEHCRLRGGVLSAQAGLQSAKSKVQVKFGHLSKERPHLVIGRKGLLLFLCRYKGLHLVLCTKKGYIWFFARKRATFGPMQIVRATLDNLASFNR